MLALTACNCGPGFHRMPIEPWVAELASASSARGADVSGCTPLRASESGVSKRDRLARVRGDHYLADTHSLNSPSRSRTPARATEFNASIPKPTTARVVLT